MALSLISPPASFVRFNESPEDHCIFGPIDLPLPMAYGSDVAFQIVLRGSTEGEAAAIYGSSVNFGLVSEYGDAVPLIVFPNTAVRSKVGPTDILFNWGAGAPGFDTVVAVGECFRFTVEVNGSRWWSNPFKRVAINDIDLCFSSVVAYGNESGGFGFFGCGPIVGMPVLPGGGTPPVDEEGNCIPMIVDIPNVPTMTIPITQDMRDKWGDIPSSQLWGYDEMGNLYNVGVSATLIGGFPPTAFYYDFGGPMIGKIRIGN